MKVRLTRLGVPAKKPGRKPSGKRKDPPHRVRPEVDPEHPLHIVLRSDPSVGSLRTARVHRAIVRTLQVMAAHSEFRVIHVSLQSDHLHLLVEADDKRGLSRGMQGFGISAAKRINAELGRARGDVFPFRYHATTITTPQEARDALALVLNNWRLHGADAGASTRLDPYASGWSFPGWYGPRDDEPARELLPVVLPMSRLLRDGWQRAGTIRAGEVPAEDPKP